MNLNPTGRYFYEKIELEESGMTLEECTWQLMTKSSDENICDQHMSGRCRGMIYYTDDKWAMTYYCMKHISDYIKDGTFVEVKNKKESK